MFGFLSTRWLQHNLFISQVFVSTIFFNSSLWVSFVHCIFRLPSWILKMIQGESLWDVPTPSMLVVPPLPPKPMEVKSTFWWRAFVHFFAHSFNMETCMKVLTKQKVSHTVFKREPVNEWLDLCAISCSKDVLQWLQCNQYNACRQ